MRAVLGFTAAAALVITAAWWLAGLPGGVTATIQGTTFQVSAPVFLASMGALFVAFYVALRLLSHLFRLPIYLRRRAQAYQRTQGEAATNRVLVALAAGEGEAARREAERARRLLGDTPLLLALSAQASQQAGREGEAEAAYRALASRPEVPLIGWRGLLRQAMARGDWEAAADYARKAEAASPNTAWMREERLSLALRTGNWADALRLASPTARAALATAAAETVEDPAEARGLAKRAFEADPSLAPAAIAYANRLRAAGREPDAQDVLRQSWKTAPHPDVADIYLAVFTDPRARLRAAEEFVETDPDHPESHLMLARALLEAGRPADARRHAEAAREAGLNQHRLWLLLADIAEAEGDAAGGRDALRFAAVADPDPVWQCEECRTQPGGWVSVCPHCGTPGKVRWVQPKHALLHGPQASPQARSGASSGASSDAASEASADGSAERHAPRRSETKDIEGVP